jgi:hypothetical protein
MPFDPTKFATQTFTSALSTEYAVPPEGEFPLQIGSFDEKSWFRVQTFKNDDGTEREAVAFEIPMEILDENVRVQMGRDKVISRYRGFIDFVNGDTGGELDFSEGKNVKLGRLREVLGQNQPGQPWNFQMLAGRGPFMGYHKVTSDKKDPDRKYGEITRVTKMGS